MSKDRSTYLYFLKVASIPIVILMTCGILIFRESVKTDLRQEQQKQVSEITHNTIRELAQKDLLFPDIVFIIGDSMWYDGLNDTLIGRVADILTKKYLNSDETTFQDMNFHPFYVLPNKSDSVGNYLLTETQLTDLKNHLDFLTKQIDIEADKVKEEVGRDIDRLNTWVSIWIAILGFFGIFIPIFINYELRKDTDQAKIKADEASKKLEEAKPQIDKVDGLEETVKRLERSLPEITEQSSTAKADAKEAANQAQTAITSAKRNENLLNAFYAISFLKDLEASTLKIVSDKKALLITILEKIHTEFQNSNDHTDHEIIKDGARQLGIRLHYISLYKFSNFHYTEDLNEFSIFILESLKKEMNKDVFENITRKLNELIEKLKNS